MLLKITQQTLGRVIQIDLRFDPPGVTVRRPIKSVYEVPTVPVFVITEEGPGILVLNPAAPELFTLAEMPSGLVSIMEKKFAERALPLERAPPNVNLQRPLPSAIAAAPVKSSRVAAAINSRNVNRQIARALSPKVLPPMPKAPQPESNSEIEVESASPEVPKPVVAEVPKPLLPETPKPLLPETPKLVVAEPVVAEVPKPVVVETPKPVVVETPKPVVVETPKPVVAEVPKPIIPESNSEIEVESASPSPEEEFESVSPPPAPLQKLIPPAPDPFVPPPPRTPFVPPPKLDSVKVQQLQSLRPQGTEALSAAPPKPQWEGPPKAPRPDTAQLPPGLARLFKKPAAETPAVEALPPPPPEFQESAIPPPPMASPGSQIRKGHIGPALQRVLAKTPSPIEQRLPEESVGVSPADQASLIPPPPSYAPPEGLQQVQQPGKLPLPRKLAPIQGTVTQQQGPNWLNSSE